MFWFIVVGIACAILGLVVGISIGEAPDNTAKVNANKLAKVQSVSNSTQEIEDFVKKNVANLSDESVQMLVARIEEIRADQIILDDNVKKRISDAAITSNLLARNYAPGTTFGDIVVNETELNFVPPKKIKKKRNA